MQPLVSFSGESPCDTAQRLRAEIARLEQADRMVDWDALPFGDRRIDACLPGGGLARGQWHEIAGPGREEELPAAATGFAAALAGRHAGAGMVVWAMQRDDLHVRGLLPFGLRLDRVIFVRAARDADVLAIVESALRTRGVTAAIGEAGTLSLTAGKRLQFACERNGATGFLLRRRLYASTAEDEGTAATTRWRIASTPSATDEPGLGPPRWEVRLERCRGGRTGAWIMEADDATGHVRVVAELADHAMATHPASRRAGTAG